MSFFLLMIRLRDVNLEDLPEEEDKDDSSSVYFSLSGSFILRWSLCFWIDSSISLDES